MPYGIEKLELYAGRYYLDVADLARARNKDVDQISKTLLCDKRSVYPAYEDPICLAVNASQALLKNSNRDDIDLLVVATESAVDYGKPISTWVHRYLELPTSCRNFEVKHACYSGTAAMRMALSWLATAAKPGKKALVVCTDMSRLQLGADSEMICGGCAVAILLSDKPEILEIQLGKEGIWTQEIADTFRPTSQHEIGDSHLSMSSYLDALDGALQNYEAQHGPLNLSLLDYHIYHAPFPGMTMQAHRTLSMRQGRLTKQEFREQFAKKVEPSLRFAKQVGSAYGSSNFLCLMGLLSQQPEQLEAGGTLSVFSYGSGCHGEFYTAKLGEKAFQLVLERDVQRQLDGRQRLSVEEYERWERLRQKLIDAQDYRWEEDGYFSQAYTGQGLLYLYSIENFRRQYRWS